MPDNALLLPIGASHGELIHQLASMSNRHGLIAGATGTGKTVTLQVLAEAFSRAGVPVFAADIKGDLSGIATPGKTHPKIDERLASIPLEGYTFEGYPTMFWDVFGKTGHPIRTTLSEMGPLLLASLLDLNDTQTGVLYACFKIADDQGLLLLDLKDLRAMLHWMTENRRDLQADYGNLSSASIAAIVRDLLVLEEQGAEHFFGEPALNIHDFIKTDFSGRGVISLLDATQLTQRSPALYCTFLLWLLSELFEELPEAGDADKPKLVFFFDEAHLLFDQASKPLLQKIEQVVRLIRSKGVGIFFVTQSPQDIDEDVLGQLGMKIQHALRAFTPKDRKAIKAVAENFRENPTLDTEQTITELGIGEALVSTLDEKGMPQMVKRTLIAPPRSRIGPLSSEERDTVFDRSPMAGRYDDAIDRESAYERLIERAKIKTAEEANAQAIEDNKKADAEPKKRGRQTATEAFFKSAMRSIGGTLGRSLGRRIVRGILGSLTGRR